MNALQRLRGAFRLLFARYEGAQHPLYRSTLQTSMQGAKFDLSPSTRQSLLRKARYFEQNSALINRLADLFETYVVGPGIQFFPSSSDDEWNANARRYLDDWKPCADLSSLQGFDTLRG
jgi:hypothetical protein